MDKMMDSFYKVFRITSLICCVVNVLAIIIKKDQVRRTARWKKLSQQVT